MNTHFARFGLFAVLFLAPAAQAAPASSAPFPCPKFGAAICRGQPCGAHSEHNFAYALRAGHVDYDWNSGLLYNPGTRGPDFKKWHYFYAPDADDIDGWCLEDCVHVNEKIALGKLDKGTRCRKDDGIAPPPDRHPPAPHAVRCFMGGDYFGGIDYPGSFPLCGATSVDEAMGDFPDIDQLFRGGRRYKTSEGGGPEGGDADQECTGGNPECICVKNDRTFMRYQNAAGEAIAAAFPDGDKPASMSEAAATKAICAAYNANPTLGRGSVCRPHSGSSDEIVIDAKAGAYSAVSIDVITSQGKFWNKAIAACNAGVH